MAEGREGRFIKFWSPYWVTPMTSRFSKIQQSLKPRGDTKQLDTKNVKPALGRGNAYLVLSGATKRKPPMSLHRDPPPQANFPYQSAANICTSFTLQQTLSQNRIPMWHSKTSQAATCSQKADSYSNQFFPRQLFIFNENEISPLLSIRCWRATMLHRERVHWKSGIRDKLGGSVTQAGTCWKYSRVLHHTAMIGLK